MASMSRASFGMHEITKCFVVLILRQHIEHGYACALLQIIYFHINDANHTL